MKLAARLEAIAAAIAELTDEELLELHRLVSRLAHRARMRDAEHRRRWELGVAASRAKADAARPQALASETTLALENLHGRRAGQSHSSGARSVL